MKVLVTGARGFVGRNLAVRLRELQHEVLAIGREDDEAAWAEAVRTADCVIHLAGANRPVDIAEFETGNVGLTRRLYAMLSAAGSRAPILYSSSIQAVNDTPYGRSKANAEQILLDHAGATGVPLAIFRLPNVFGKWTRVSYNSAIATFCHRIARGEPIEVHDPAAPLRLVYVDDVIDAFLPLMSGGFATGYHEVVPVCITRGDHYHHSKVEKFLVISGRAGSEYGRWEFDRKTLVDSLEVWVAECR